MTIKPKTIEREVRDKHGHWQGRAERTMSDADVALKCAHLDGPSPQPS